VTTTATTVTTTETTQTTGTTEKTTETTASSKQPDEEGRCGDVNLDDVVSLVDVVCLNKYLAGSVTLNDTALSNADCCDDGAVNGSDVTALLKYVVESIDVLPVVPE
jgi:hypothetical protein